MKIYVTGVGGVASNGNSIEDIWSSLEENRSGISLKNHLSDTLGVPVLLAEASTHKSKERLFSIAKSALTECFNSAALDSSEISNAGLVFSQSAPDFELIAKEALRISSTGRARPDTVFKTMNNSIPARLAKGLKINGPVSATASACSGSALALHTAIALIKSGQIGRCFCGGGEIISDLMYRSFESMRVVLTPSLEPENSVLPFGTDRSGIVLGEGSAFVLLESEECVEKRGATPLLEIANSKFENVPEAIWGDIPDERIWSSLIERTTMGGAVDYVLSHGTSTLKGDYVEGAALQSTLPDSIVTSFKGIFGHTLAASTLLDVAVATKCVEMQKFIGVGSQYSLDNKLKKLKLITENSGGVLENIVKLSAGFGGGISCLYFKRVS